MRVAAVIPGMLLGLHAFELYARLLHRKPDFCKRFDAPTMAALLHCGKSLYQLDMASVLRCSNHNALPETGGFCIFGGLLFRPVKVPRRWSDGDEPPGRRQGATTDSPWETATRQGWQPVWAFPVQEALRQVGPIELQARCADEEQRGFSWLLFS